MKLLLQAAIMILDLIELPLEFGNLFDGVDDHNNTKKG